MIAITPAQIRAARDNDLSAISAVLEATEERVSQLAYHASKSRPEWREDAEQIAREQVWICITKFDGNTTAEFFTFMDRSIRGALSDQRRTEQYVGVGATQAKIFEAAYKDAKGDAALAERMVTELEPGRRLSKESARAVRQAFAGTISLSAPAGLDQTVESVLADTAAPVDADLATADDLNAEQANQRRMNVRATLAMLGAQQRVVIAARTGVEMNFYGPATKDGVTHDDELAEDYGIPRQRIKVIRSKGNERFAELYVEHFAPEWEGVREAAKANGEV